MSGRLLCLPVVLVEPPATTWVGSQMLDAFSTQPAFAYDAMKASIDEDGPHHQKGAVKALVR